MIVLENIKKIGNIITATFCFPDGDEKGNVEYDILTDSIKKLEYTEGDDGGTHYGEAHIIQSFHHMVEADKYPETYRNIWY